MQSVLSQDIQSYIANKQSNIDNNIPIYYQCKLYFDTFLHNYLQAMQQICSTQPYHESLTETLSQINKDLDQMIHVKFSQLCIDNIFNIVKEFPESFSLLVELQHSLQQTNQLNDLSDELQQ